jgi:signal transduction histidine kinase
VIRGCDPAAGCVASVIVKWPNTGNALEKPSPAERVIVAFATAGDVSTGMAEVVTILREDSRAARVEWWAPSADANGLELRTADGPSGGTRDDFPLGSAGALVVRGLRSGSGIEAVLDRLAPVLRRRVAGEKLVEQTALLARRNEALDDFAALLAHELKGPLQAALLAPPDPVELERALLLIDAILEAARSEGDCASAETQPVIQAALSDLGAVSATIDTALPPRFPLPATLLRIVLRNLIANALAAGALNILVAGSSSPSGWRLAVDDDGVGLEPASADRYVHGSGIALALCRRIADRFGGAIELRPLPAGGMRASLLLQKADR